MSRHNPLWKPEDLDRSFKPNDKHDAFGGPVHRGDEEEREAAARRAQEADALGYSWEPALALVARLDRKRMGRREEGVTPNKSVGWAQSLITNNREGVCPAWDYTKGAWDGDGSPYTWTHKRLSGGNAMQANRDRYLHDMASGKLPQRGFKPGLEPLGSIFRVDHTQRKGKLCYFMKGTGEEVWEAQPARREVVENSWLNMSLEEYVKAKCPTTHPAEHTPRELHKLKQTRRKSQQLSSLPEYEPDLAWVEDLSLPTPLEDARKRAGSVARRRVEEAYDDENLYVKSTDFFGDAA